MMPTYKVETWYTHEQLVDVSCLLQLDCCLYSLYFFIFLSNFQTLKIFFAFFFFFFRNWGLQSWMLVHRWTVGGYIVYTTIRSLYFRIFLSNFSNIKTFLSLFSVQVFQELWGLQSWNLVHTWTMGGCIVSFFSPILKHFRHNCLRNCEVYEVETWYTWTMGGSIVYTGIRLLLLMCPFISSCSDLFIHFSFFLSLQCSVTNFSFSSGL